MIRDEFRKVTNINDGPESRYPFLQNSLFWLTGLEICFLNLLYIGTAFPVKTKILLSVLVKKTQLTFTLDNISTYKMNDGPNEKISLCLKNQTEKNYCCRMN